MGKKSINGMLRARAVLGGVPKPSGAKKMGALKAKAVKGAC